MPHKKDHCIETVGSRAKVYHGNAKKTTGGLTKSDLTMNSRGDIVSKRKQELGYRLYRKYEAELKPYQFTKSTRRSRNSRPKSRSKSRSK